MADIQQITPAMEIAEREVARTLRREKSAGQSVGVILLFVGLLMLLPAGVDVLGVVQTEP